MIRRAVPALAVALGALLAPFVVVPTATAAILPCDGGRPYRDLDGDGFEDAVVGDPYATVEGKAEAGTVTVLFGDDDGRIGEGSARRVLTQRDFDQTPEVGDHFGWAVALSRFDDGCYRVLIGVPGEDVDGHPDAGMAHLITLNGGPSDNPTALDRKDTVLQSDVGGTVEAGDEFGHSVAAHPDNAEFDPEVAFGAPGENENAGVVNVAGVLFSGVQERQGARGVPGRFQAGDRFGEVVGYFDYLPGDVDDPPDLFVGAPGDVVDGRAEAGSVNVLRGSASRLITQNTAGVPGTAEAGDHFGASLADNQLPPVRTFKQVAIGAPGEDVGSARDAGSVTVLRRTDDTTYPAVSLTQSTAGVAGSAESGDQFGSALAYRDDRTLAVGIPGEDLGAVADAGSVQIVRVGKANLSFPSPSITEDSPGTPGTVRAGSRFGSSVAGLPATDQARTTTPGGFGEAVFAITSGQDGGSVYVISDESAVSPRAWKPGTGGIPGVGVRFGRSVA